MAGQISDDVTVTARIQPEGVARREFGPTLFLDHVTTTPATRNAAVQLRAVNVYPDATSLAADNPPASVSAAGAIYFQQVPFPKSLVVASVIATAQPAFIFGGEPGTVIAIEALGDNVSFTLDGNDFMVDFDGVTTTMEVAAAFQTGVRTVAAYAAATVTYDSASGYVIQAAAGTGFGDGFADASTTETMGLGSTAVVFPEIALPETPSIALSRIIAINCDFFGISPALAIARDATLVDDFRDWVAQRRLSFMAGIDVWGVAALVPNETTSIAATLAAQGGDGIFLFWNGRTEQAVDHKALSYMGRFSSINFDRPNAVINGKFLTLPGCLPTDLSSTEKAELDRKRINVYVPAGRAASNVGDTKEGVSLGTWVDVYVWLAWFKDALEVEGYNWLKQTAGVGGIPITDQGLAATGNALESVCERGVVNGGLAPNLVSAALTLAIQRTTGNVDFDGFLSVGYLVHRPRAVDIDQSLRNSRGPLPISIFAKGSGKVNNLDIAVVLEN